MGSSRCKPVPYVSFYSIVCISYIHDQTLWGLAILVKLKLWGSPVGKRPSRATKKNMLHCLSVGQSRYILARGIILGSEFFYLCFSHFFPKIRNLLSSGLCDLHSSFTIFKEFHIWQDIKLSRILQMKFNSSLKWIGNLLYQQFIYKIYIMFYIKTITKWAVYYLT